jgi:hypothetical protein
MRRDCQFSAGSCRLPVVGCQNGAVTDKTTDSQQLFSGPATREQQIIAVQWVTRKSCIVNLVQKTRQIELNQRLTSRLNCNEINIMV